MRAQTGNQKPQTVVILWVLIMTICLASWSSRLPANLIAEFESDPKENLASLLQQAEQAKTDRLWRQAVRRYEQALNLAVPSRYDELKERLRFCQTNANLEKRYRDESIARFLKNSDPKTAHLLLAEVCKTISLKYYLKTNPKQLLRNALYHLRIAAQNPLVLQQLHANPSTSKFLQKRIDNLQLLCREKNCQSLRSLIEITEAPLTDRPNNNLNAWLLTELAYALADGLDEYSYLLTPHQYKSLYEHLGGYYVGVGVDLVFRGSFPTVFDVVPNSPAAQAGIRPGDLLTRIADVPLNDKPDDLIAKLLTGAPNTPVSLCLRRDNRETLFSLTRSLVEAPTVRYVQILNPKNKIGYLRISNFDRDTALEVRRALDSLIRRGLQKLIIDLRYNGGGIMASAIDAARLFLERGAIVTVLSAQHSRRYVVDKNGSAVFQLPLVLLVDENTASAAEIFAAALQDHQRAVLVGQNTLGKALVQTIFPLDRAPSGLCITTASYLPPSRNSFQGTGVKPDVLIKKPETGNRKPEPILSMTDFLSDRDPTLKTALNILTAHSTQLAKK